MRCYLYSNCMEPSIVYQSSLVCTYVLSKLLVQFKFCIYQKQVVLVSFNGAINPVCMFSMVNHTMLLLIVVASLKYTLKENQVISKSAYCEFYLFCLVNCLVCLDQKLFRYLTRNYKKMFFLKFPLGFFSRFALLLLKKVKGFSSYKVNQVHLVFKWYSLTRLLHSIFDDQSY